MSTKPLAEMTCDEIDANARKQIAESNFALPEEKKYPIHDIAHARNALARSSGKPEESKVKAAVYKKWPSLKPDAGSKLAERKEAVVMCERGVFKLSEIKLAEGKKNPDVQVLRVGKFNHPDYGVFEITPLTLQEMKDNFDKKVRGIDIAFDYFHESGKDASGWPTALYLSEDGTELWAKVDWTPTAQQKLSERAVRYFSPDFAFKWTDPETGAVFKNVLFGGGLTNRPFVKEMAAIVASEGKGTKMDEELKKMLEQMNASILKLSEKTDALEKKMDEADGDGDENPAAPAKKGASPNDAGGDAGDDEDDGSEVELSDDPAVLKQQAAKMQGALKKHKAAAAASKAEAEKSLQAKELAEKENKFNVLLSEGKACVAQKDAFMSGDMIKFARLAKSVNLSENGHKGGSGNEGDGAGSSEREDKVLKLAEQIAKDEKIQLHEAIKVANKRVPKE